LNYYNEFDPKAAQWLRALVDVGLIPEGEVDERSIADVEPGDLEGYRQCHFFAGIGGWSYALELAGWDESRPVWTGSCPCQPFSAAGKRRGTDDARHLWPEFVRLIAECRPATVFGEQVASKAGREWLSGVRANLEALGYGVGAADLCAASAGAPHIRQRLFWVADAKSEGGCGRRQDRSKELRGSSEASGPPDADEGQRGRFPDGEGREFDGAAPGRQQGDCEPEPCGVAGPWSDYRVIEYADGKRRRIPTEPAFYPLDARLPGRVVQLRGLGNAIVPQVAAEFIGAYEDIRKGCPIKRGVDDVGD